MTSDSNSNRRRYKFIGRDGRSYVWQSVNRIPGDSRVEEIRCGINWFWGVVS